MFELSAPFVLATGDQAALCVFARHAINNGWLDVPVYVIGDAAAVREVGWNNVSTSPDLLGEFIVAHATSTRLLPVLALGPFYELLDLPRVQQRALEIAVRSFDVVEAMIDARSGVLVALNDAFGAVVLGHETLTFGDAAAGSIGPLFDAQLAANDGLAAFMRATCMHEAERLLGRLAALAARVHCLTAHDAFAAAVDLLAAGERPPTDPLHTAAAALADAEPAGKTTARAFVERTWAQARALIVGRTPRRGLLFAAAVIEGTTSSATHRLMTPTRACGAGVLIDIEGRSKRQTERPPERVRFFGAPSRADELACAAFFPVVDPPLEL